MCLSMCMCPKFMFAWCEVAMMKELMAQRAWHALRLLNDDQILVGSSCTGCWVDIPWSSGGLNCSWCGSLLCHAMMWHGHQLWATSKCACMIERCAMGKDDKRCTSVNLKSHCQLFLLKFCRHLCNLSMNCYVCVCCGHDNLMIIVFQWHCLLSEHCLVCAYVCKIDIQWDVSAFWWHVCLLFGCSVIHSA